jgi:DNA polymerase
MELVRQAIAMDTRSRCGAHRCHEKADRFDNPNSVQQMKQWLSDNGLEVDSLGKKEVTEMLKTAPAELQKRTASPAAAGQVVRQEVSGDGECRHAADGRAGACSSSMVPTALAALRTLVQMQNLPQNHIRAIWLRREALVRCGDFEGVDLLYDDVPDTLSQLIRTAFIPKLMA